MLSLIHMILRGPTKELNQRDTTLTGDNHDSYAYNIERWYRIGRGRLNGNRSLYQHRKTSVLSDDVHFIERRSKDVGFMERRRLIEKRRFSERCLFHGKTSVSSNEVGFSERNTCMR